MPDPVVPDPSIITLTSIPPRFDRLGPTLVSLLAQRPPADEIRLTIPRRYRRFPGWDGRLPAFPHGIRIVRADEDLGPATKVLPTALDLRGQAVDLVFCDDDKVYGADWLRRFKALRAARPADVLCEAGENFPDIADCARPAVRLPRAVRRRRGMGYRLVRTATLGRIKPHIYLRSGYVDMLSGYGGVMLRPDDLDDEAFHIPEVLWTVDDPWLSGHLERRGIGIWLNALDGNAVAPRRSRSGRIGALGDLVENGHDRVQADLAAIDWMRARYGIWTPAGPPTRSERWMTASMQALARRSSSDGH